MAHWLRLILSVLALVGLLAAGTSGAFAAKSQHQCCPEMSAAEMSQTLDDHGGGGGDKRAALPECCVMGVCAFVAPMPPPFASAADPNLFVLSAAPAMDDAPLKNRAPSPDLRPPIA